MTAVITADAKQLVEAYKHGDAEAFDEIVRCYYEGLFAHALRRLGDAHAAEDAVQETLLRAYGALHRFNGQYHLRAWLHRILSNVCHDEGARRQREVRLVEKASGTDVEPVDDEFGDELLDRLAIPRRQVLDALASLPEPYRKALVLRYVEELSFREVAEATGVTEGNARARVHRARAALKATLGGSLALIGWLIPMLRRAERTAVADTGSSVNVTIAASHASPVVSRFAEMGLVEKAASLAGSLGIAASLAVPVGVSQVADRVKPPPPPAAANELETVAEPPAASTKAAAAPPSTAAPAPAARSIVDRPTVTAAPASTSEQATIGKPAAGTATAAPAVAGESAGGSTATPRPGGTSGTPTPAPADGGTATPPPVAPAPKIKTFTLDGSDLTATSGWRTDLAGAIKVRVGDQKLKGNLTGVLEAEPRPTPPQPAPADSQASTTTTTAAPAPPKPRAFTSEMTLRFDDGRIVRLKLTGSLTDAEDGRSAATGELRAFDDVCGTELGTAKLAGTLLLRDAPLSSSMTLNVDGFALDDAATAKSGCAP